jgi:glyoxylate/hydroxypyruvate reductase
MRLLLQSPAPIAAWRDALAAALPEARITVWPEVDPEPDAALVWKPPEGLFARVRPQRAIVNLGAGVDALLRTPDLPAHIPVVRLEDAGMAEQMAEYVTLAVLAAFREQAAYRAQQRAASWLQRPRLAKAEFVVGLLGLGVLGGAVAEALRALAFPVAAWTRRRRPMPGIEAFAGDAELGPMLARTRVLVCMLPSSEATRGLLNQSRLSMLPRGAHVVNVARGDLVADADLLALLDEGHLASATLDVFVDEPLPPGHAFWHHPAVTLTPHVSAATLIGPSVAQIAHKLRALMRGEHVGGVVDRELGY